MAYARYDRTCDWYIFWYCTKADQQLGLPTSKEGEKLAVWHVAHRSYAPILTYSDVREILQTADFSRIPGYQGEHRPLLTECFEEFISDVNDEWEPSAS